MINLNGFKNFQKTKEEFASLVRKNAGPEDESKAFGSMMDALSGDLTEYITKQVKAKTDPILNAKKTDPEITPEEVKFFNDLTSDNLTHKTSEEVTIPETTVDKIFEDITTEHPLLDIIGLKNTGVRLKFLKSDAEGAAVWGKLFGDIQGQLTGTFSDEEADQSKLTAFVAIPNDVAEYGASWIKTFVMTQITEAFAVAAESAFLTGDGDSKPIGLNRNLSNGTTTNGVTTYATKIAAGTITLADTETAKKELGAIVKALSKKENGKPYAAKGKVVLVVQPGASIDMEAAMTMQNVNGQWVLAYPFGLQVIESVYVPDGQLIAFVPDRYDAYSAGPVEIKQFDQTLALQDGTLYTAKRFFYGKAEDNNVSQVYTLDVTTTSSKSTSGSTTSGS